MEKLAFGDIIILKFPFTDGKSFKRLPALVLSDFQDGDILVCRITSKIYQSRNDARITEWQKVGLKLPSVIRVHKLATLDKDLYEKLLGRIDNSDKKLYNLFSQIS